MKRLLSLIAVLLLCAIASHAAIGFDSSTAISTASTFTATVAANSNRWLGVGCTYYSSAGTISSMTYAGTAMTKVGRFNDGTHAATVEIWKILAPSTGTNNVVVTWGSQPNFFGCSAISLYAVNQSTDVDTSTSHIVTGTTISNPGTITTANAGEWILNWVLAAATVSAGSSQTNVQTLGIGGGGFVGSSATGPFASPGSQAQTWTYASNGNASMEGLIALVPDTVTAAPTISSVSPTGAGQNSVTSVTINGTNFIAGASVAVSGTLVTPSSVVIVNSGQITATFTVDVAAAQTTRNVTVTTSGGTSNAGLFTVTGPVPTITSLSPSQGDPGSAYSVTITGTNFQGSPLTVGSLSKYVTVTGVTVNSTTQITATFTVANPAISGIDGITVTTPSGTSNTSYWTINSNFVAPTDTVTLTDLTGAGQTNRPFTISRVFAKGEIAHYPQPTGTGVSATWQADVKNRWRDGSQTVNVSGAVTYTAGQSYTSVKLTAAANTFIAGDIVTIANVGGVTITGGLGSNRYVVEQADGTNVVLMNSSMTGAYTSGGTIAGPAPGSVKHALVSGYATLSANSAVTVSFADNANPCSSGNQAACNAASQTTTASMLAPSWMSGSPSWDADMEFTAAASTVTVDARTLLTNLSIATGQITYWMQGPVATSVIVEDRTTSLSQDIAIPGSLACGAQNPCKSIHPWFVLTFYNGWNGVQVDYIAEDDWAGKLQSLTYDLVLKAGGTLAQVYSKTGAGQRATTTWWKQFWSGTQPGAVKTDLNLAYMAYSKAIPNFDTNNTLSSGGPPSAGTIASIVSAFNATDKGDIGTLAAPSHGTYNLTMSNTGLYQYIGWMETWLIDYLANPDPSMIPVVWGNAAVSGYLPWHMYEDTTSGGGQACSSSRCYNALGTIDAFGKNVSMDARTTSYAFSNTVGWGTGADAITALDIESCVAMYEGVTWGCSNTTRAQGVWAPDHEHQSEFAYIPYLLSGNPYFLKEMYAIATADSMENGPGCGFFGYCRPFGLIQEASDQPRGTAWATRNLANAAFLAPDGSAEQWYYNEKLNYNLAVREGEYQITTGNYFTSLANTAYQRGSVTYSGSAGAPSPLPNPLHTPVSMDGNASPCNNTFANCSTTGAGVSEFHVLYLTTVYGHIRDMGYAADKIVDFMTDYWLGHILDPASSPWTFITYADPFRDQNQKYYTSWSAQHAGYLTSYLNAIGSNYDQICGCQTSNQADTIVSGGGYVVLGLAALSFDTSHAFNGMQAMDALNWIINSIPISNANGLFASMGQLPKWSILPRAAVSGTSPVTILTGSLPGATLTAAYSQTLSATGGTSPYTWACGTLPSGLSLNTSTGVISGTPNGSAGTTNFNCTATDSLSTASSAQPLGVTVAAAPVITTASLPAGITGSAYSQTLVTTGGTAPLTFTVSVGSLPTGVSLGSSTGTISGTPSATCSCSFTIQVADANSVTGTKALSISVTAPSNNPVISVTSLPNGTQNVFYSQLMAASQGTPPYTWSISAGSLPTGLSLGSSTGIISGGPSAAGSYSFTVKVTDSATNFATQAFNSFAVVPAGGASQGIGTSNVSTQ
jgi:hypothetical protein